MPLGNSSDSYAFNVYVKLLDDQEAVKRVKKGLTSVEEELVRIGNSMDAVKAKSLSNFVKIKEAFEKANDSAVKLRQNVERIRQIGTGVGNLSRILVGGGLAATGGIFALANKYVQDAKVATATTTAWKNEMAKLERVRDRIGAVLAREALPALKLAAQLAAKIASFVEANPGVVKAALNGGLIVAGIGLIGTLIAKGISLYADVSMITASVTQLTAAKIMADAGNKQLLAAGLGSKGGSVASIGGAIKNLLGLGGAASGAGGAAGLGGALAILTPVVLTLAAALGGLLIGVKAYDAFVKKGLLKGPNAAQFATGGAYQLGQFYGKVTNRLGGNLSQEEIDRKSIIFAANIGKLTGAIDENSPLWLKASKLIKQSSEEVQEALTGLANADIRNAALDAFSSYKQEEAESEKKYLQERQKIQQDGRNAMLRADEQYSKTVGQIARQLQKSLENATADYQRADAKAQADFMKERADILKDAGKAALEAEKDLQKDLKELQKRRDEDSRDAINRRDALALINAQKTFNEERRARIQEKNEQLRQIRQDKAEKLAELSQQFAEERAQRFAEYQQRLIDLNAQAEEQRQAAAEAHSAEIEQIRRNTADRLKELYTQQVEERKRRYQEFVQKLRDIDATLLGERNLRNKYSTAMLADLNAFLRNYQSQLATLGGGAAGARATGGYVRTDGLYRLAEGNNAEFVLSASTTKLLERVLGGTISQNALARLAIGQGGKNITLNDSRRFDSRLSARDRRQISNDTMTLLTEVLS